MIKMKNKKTLFVLISALFFVCILAVGVLGFLGNKSEGQTDRPACSGLSSIEDVDSALDSHSAITKNLENISPSVSVSKTVTCDNEKALITVSYSGDLDTFEEIQNLLKNTGGYGVALEVVKK